MKVLVLIDAWFPFTGGAQVQIKNLNKILKKNYGCQYIVLHSPSANIIIRFLWSFWVIPQAYFLHFRHKFDLIHSHAYWPGIPGIILSKILKLPHVFTVHGSNLLDLKSRSFKAWLEKIVLTKIKYDQVISTSSNFFKYKNVNNNITVIHNGVDLKAFDKVKDLEKKEKPFEILFVGRDDPVKGLKYLKKAVSNLKNENPFIKLKIITQGIKFKDLIKEYKSSHLFVLPSLSEGQPLTLLEAWAAKLPVVVTTVGENPNMVKHGYNGYLVKPGNVEVLEKAILRVIKDKKRELMGKRGYQLVKKEYLWQRCANKTYKVYCQVLNEAG